LTTLAPDGQRYYISQEFGGDDSPPDPLWYDFACTSELLYETVMSLLTAENTFWGGTENAIMMVDFSLDGPAWLTLLFAEGNCTIESATVYLQGLANAITAVMRQRSDTSSSQPASGVALGAQTCIRVAWAYLAAPAVLIVLTWALLCATVAQSRQQRLSDAAQPGRRPWKSSLLPVLGCGLSGERRDSYGTLDDVHRMREYASSFEVRLRRIDELERQPAPRAAREKSSGRWTLVEDRV
jgi:hypothetical protein